MFGQNHLGIIRSPDYVGCKGEWVREGRWEPVLEDQDTKLVHFIGKTQFSLHYFSCDVKSRRKLYFARQCACK
jgi:hypothetical protein